MDECNVCANADTDYCFACDNGNQFKPMTNADRIRAMTDEELAKHICCPYDQCINLDKPCDECVLDWLKSPVEGGE